MGGKIYTTDVGTKIQTTLKNDLTGHSLVQYKVQYSDDSTDDLPCVVESIDLTDPDNPISIVYYIKTAADFDVVGDAQVHVEATIPSGLFLGTKFTVPLFAPFT